MNIINYDSVYIRLRRRSLTISRIDWVFDVATSIKISFIINHQLLSACTEFLASKLLLMV